MFRRLRVTSTFTDSAWRCQYPKANIYDPWSFKSNSQSYFCFFQKANTLFREKYWIFGCPFECENYAVYFIHNIPSYKCHIIYANHIYNTFSSVRMEPHFETQSVEVEMIVHKWVKSSHNKLQVSQEICKSQDKIQPSNF